MRKHFIAATVVALAAIAIPSTAEARGANSGHRGKHDVVRVSMNDNCDPASFNAVLGAGACQPHGAAPTVTLGEFFAKLNPVDFGHPQWNFMPANIELEGHETLKVTVHGGETHTFTEVADFGPGCVDVINQALGLTVGAPTPAECGAFFATTAVAPGGVLKVGRLSDGVHKFMCEIHPWMRSVVTVGENEHEDDD